MTSGSQLDQIEARLQLLEDHYALVQLVNRYGPSVDGGASEEAASIWSDGGTYETGGASDDTRVSWTGHDALVGLFESDLHQGLITRGCSHFVGTPHLEIDGDRATGIGYAFLFTKHEEGVEFAVVRVLATRWDFERSAYGWRVVRRVNRNLEGDPAACALFRSAVESWDYPR